MVAAMPIETPDMPETRPMRAVDCEARPAIPPMQPSADAVAAMEAACGKPRLMRPKPPMKPAVG